MCIIISSERIIIIKTQLYIYINVFIRLEVNLNKKVVLGCIVYENVNSMTY